MLHVAFGEVLNAFVSDISLPKPVTEDYIFVVVA